MSEPDVLEFISEFEKSMEAQEEAPVAVCDLSNPEVCEACD